MSTSASAMPTAAVGAIPAEGDRASRLGGLRRFAVAITLLNIIGRVFLGFEQSWLQVFTAVATAYSLELGLELLLAWAERRRPRFLGGWRVLADFLLSAHIAAFAVSMLLYGSDRLAPFSLIVRRTAICASAIPTLSQKRWIEAAAASPILVS